MAAFTVLLSRDEASGRYTVVCPALFGCVTEAKNRRHALDAMGDAIEQWGKAAAEEGLLPSAETEELIGAEELALQNDRLQQDYSEVVERAQVEGELPPPQRVSLAPRLDAFPIRIPSDQLTLLTIRAMVRSVNMTYEEFLDAVVDRVGDEDDDGGD